MKYHSISVDQARYSTSVVAKSLDDATVKVSAKLLYSISALDWEQFRMHCSNRLTHCKENAFCKEWRKMQDAQDWLVWGRSAVGVHWYQECKWTWSKTKNEIYYGNTGKWYRTLVQEGWQNKGYSVEQEFCMTILDLV